VKAGIWRFVPGHFDSALPSAWSYFTFFFCPSFFALRAKNEGQNVVRAILLPSALSVTKEPGKTAVERAIAMDNARAPDV
jgi:hypothetical protein